VTKVSTAAGAAELVEGIRQKNRSALARTISWVENGHEGFEEVLTRIHGDVGKAYRVGITGPPGAGKSTLTEQLAGCFLAKGESVAIVAVDPTSKVTGGALLGDRIRMADAAGNDNVFIRSMATRGAVGGLSVTTTEVCDVLDAFGFEKIIIETVGVGQSELAVTDTADCAILVVVPESGDSVQVLKAGVMEMADIFVVNKADRPGAQEMAKSILEMLEIRVENSNADSIGGSWEAKVLETVALSGEGVGRLAEYVDLHKSTAENNGSLAKARMDRRTVHTKEIVERSIKRLLWHHNEFAGSVLDSVAGGELSPYDAARSIVKNFLHEQEKG